MGRIAVMIGGIEAEKTPLERRMDVFGSQVAKVIFAIALVVTVAGLSVEGWARMGHVFLFAVALAVAAVPEGLPAVLTITLALGVERMSKRKAVVRRLSAVEALGSVTMIATDKTDTLTENRMTVQRVDPPEPQRALLAMVLANDAEVGTGAGDPLELALLEYASSQGMDAGRVHAENPRKSSLPFDSGDKYMRHSSAPLWRCHRREDGVGTNLDRGAADGRGYLSARVDHRREFRHPLRRSEHRRGRCSRKLHV